MPTLTIVAGANGAGKSTLTQTGRAAFQDHPILDSDAVSKAILATTAQGESAISAGRCRWQKSS